MGGEYSRWRNRQDPGMLMFVTTTVLGYTPVLRSDAAKRTFLQSLAADCRFHGAVLHAYCVMDHHVHLVLRAPSNMSMSRFVQGFKSRSAKALLVDASRYDRRRLREAAKDGRSLWMRSFRGIPVRNEEVFWKCVTYVHLNPVRAGLCAWTTDYEWSSARLFEACRWSEEEGLARWLD